MNHPTTTARADRADGLTGLTVLFLPKNSRTAYFQSLLCAARQDHGWRIHVVCPPGGEATWRETIGGEGTLGLVPDFSLAGAREQDASASAELDDFIAACEHANGTSVGRIILAGERHLGRGFSGHIFHWPHDRTARRVLADNTEPLRIAQRMFAFARQTLSTTRPDLVVTGEWADPLCFVFYLVARQMGMPCVVNRMSKLWSGRCYWSADPAMYNIAARSIAGAKLATSEAVSQQAKDRVAAFRNGPDTLGYVKQNWQALDRQGWTRRHIDLARLLGVELRHFIQGRQGPPPKPALRALGDFYRQAWLKRRQSALFKRFDEGALRDMRYIFIAQHKDPEQALNYQAPFWSNQLNTVALLSGSLPDGFKLLVREHRNNAGRRPTRYYKDMLRLPGVVLIDGFDDQFKYIRQTDLVVTDNGSTGWEGLMLGRRVLTLADTYYDGAGLSRRVRDPERLASLVVEALQRPAVADAAGHDRALACMLDAEWETSAPLGPEGHGRALELLAEIYERLSPAAADAKALSA